MGMLVHDPCRNNPSEVTWGSLTLSSVRYSAIMHVAATSGFATSTNPHAPMHPCTLSRRMTGTCNKVDVCMKTSEQKMYLASLLDVFKNFESMHGRRVSVKYFVTEVENRDANSFYKKKIMQIAKFSGARIF